MTTSSRWPGYGRPRRGFTLMETLVVLVIVSLTVLVMFQMLGSYRLARERVAMHAGDIDRQALVRAWLTDSVRGLQALRDAPFEGHDSGFAGRTLNPVVSAPGAPTAVEWAIVRDGDGWVLVYREDDVERWRLPLRGDERPRFVYFARAGGDTPRWPPELGVQDLLPGSVALVQGTRVQIASVLGPVRERIDPWQLETE
ncbi:type II secretion system protein [Lysobacter sp. N42]|nr:type II secretion system protein [Lysobacter sp. N42]TCZ86184.1 type II secretion system protein [Lysobacter sp. N42]